MLQPKIIRHNQSSVTLYPERWGIITSIRFWDTELLYQSMLGSTLHDMTKSVRGGVPILFPNPGFLTDEEKEKSWYSLPQHGFARTNAWKISESRHCEDAPSRSVGSTLGVRSNPGSCSQLTQSLSSSDVPDMFGYEWQWSIENSITLSGSSVELRYSIANTSDKELPISFGLHPYWAVPLWEKSTLEWNFAWGDIIASDITNWSTGGTTRIDMPSDGIVRVTIPWIGNLELHVSPDFRRLWVWSLPGQDFVCVEPMMGDDGNILRDPIMISVGEKHESWLRIRLR
jgi:galactose mutarotase-like enzyme